MKRNASAVWRGDLKNGTGIITTVSGVLKDAPYSFSTRFGNGIGTNPEELVAAAHAGCFAMAFSAELVRAGLAPEVVRAEAAVTLEKTDAGFTVTESRLDVRAKVPGASKAKVLEIANAAKIGCPISRLFNTRISMNVKIGV